MPNAAQTRRSAEPDAGVLKHEREELMDTSSPQQDINDVDSLIVSSEKDTLLVDVNAALSILHETTIKQGNLALSTKKSARKWRFTKRHRN